MNKLFSKDIYKQALKNLSMISILTAVISIMTTVILIASKPIGLQFGRFVPGPYWLVLNNSHGYTAAGMAPVLIVVMFFGAVFFTYTVFRYQNKRALSDKIHSLPYTKVQLCVSGVLAVLTVLYSTVILTLLSAWITLNAVGSQYILSHVFLSALGYMAGITLITGITATAMSFTGNAFANLTVTAVLLFLPRTILFLIGTIITRMSFNFINLNELNVFLNPSTNIPVGIVLDAFRLWEYNGVSEILISGKSIIYTFVLAAVYLVAALILSNKRKSELAGKSFGNITLSYVFAALCTAPLAAYGSYMYVRAHHYMFTNHFISSLQQTSIVFLPFVFILFFTIGAIYNAGIKKALKGTLIFMIISVLTVGSVILGAIGAKSIISRPIRAEEIEYVKIDLNPEKNYRNTPVYTYGMLKAKDVKIYDEELIEFMVSNTDITIDMLSKVSQEGYNTFEFTNLWCEFYLKNGRKVVRNVPVHRENDMVQLSYTILTNEQLSTALMSLPEISEIEMYYLNYFAYRDNLEEKYYEKTDEIFKSLMSELATVDISQRRILSYNFLKHDYDYGYGDSTNEMQIYGRYNNIAYKNQFDINNNLPKTKKLYMKAVFEYSYNSFCESLDFILNNSTDTTDMYVYIFLDSIRNPSLNREKSLLRYHSYGDEQQISYEQLIAFLSELIHSQVDDFDKYDNYAQLDFRVNDSHLDVYIPMSDEAYEYWMNIALNIE